MNIWGLKKETKRIIISKKLYLEKTKNKGNYIVIKNFDQGIINRKKKIRKLRNERVKKKKLKR